MKMTTINVKMTRRTRIQTLLKGKKIGKKIKVVVKKKQFLS